MRQASQVLAPTAASTSDATLFTGASTSVTIIRTIFVANTSASAQTFSLALGATAATAANCLFSAVPIPANTTTIIYGPITLPVSGTLHGLASATSVTFSASGELSAAGG